MLAPGIAGCEVKLPFPNVALAMTLQQCEWWCWAASISMIFKFFGHPLDQAKIVRQLYPDGDCSGASNAEMADALSDSWTDDHGGQFESTITAVYDSDTDTNHISNAIVVNELLNGRPLLYGNGHHAMVVCAANYRTTPGQPMVDQIWVMDPWPSAQRVHALTQSEMLAAHLGGDLHFLASVQIS
jgi:hypothetical protein